jgi:AcrR family transcriptional regulator
MRASPKTVQKPPSEMDKPVKQRIAEQASRLFIFGGVNISTAMIAHFAHTNVATIMRNFGTRERLVFDFLKAQMKEAERAWEEIEQEHPNDPETQVRKWVLYAEFSADLSMQAEQAQLSRAAVDLLGFGFDRKDPLLSEIERFWQAERRKVAKLCEKAKFRDPAVLADKLLLLVQGARNERNGYGFAGPSQKVGEAGDDLMVAHGAQRKPPLEV